MWTDAFLLVAVAVELWIMPSCFMPFNSVQVSGMAARASCIKGRDSITIIYIQKLSDGVFVTCTDHVTNETWRFDGLKDGDLFKMMNERVEAKLRDTGLDLSLGELAKGMERSKCFVQIDKAPPFDCSALADIPSEPTDPKSEASMALILGLTLPLCILGVGLGLGVAIYIRRKNSGGVIRRGLSQDQAGDTDSENEEEEPHTGSAANGIVRSSALELLEVDVSQPKEPETQSSVEVVGLLEPRPLRDYYTQPQESGPDAVELADMGTRQDPAEVLTTPQQALAQLGKLRNNTR